MVAARDGVYWGCIFCSEYYKYHYTFQNLVERVLTPPPPHKYSAFSYAHVIKMEFNELHGRCVIVVAKRGGVGEGEGRKEVWRAWW